MIIIACIGAAIGCSTPTETDPIAQASMSASIDGIAWNCPAEGVSAATSTVQTVITGYSGSVTNNSLRTLTISMPSTMMAVGTYALDTIPTMDALTVQYREGITELYQVPATNEGFIRITEVTPGAVKGEFAFVLLGLDITTGEYISKQFTAGTFVAPFAN